MFLFLPIECLHCAIFFHIRFPVFTFIILMHRLFILMIKTTYVSINPSYLLPRHFENGVSVIDFAPVMTASSLMVEDGANTLKRIASFILLISTFDDDGWRDINRNRCFLPSISEPLPRQSRGRCGLTLKRVRGNARKMILIRAF